jgi:hypothetical protein
MHVKGQPTVNKSRGIESSYESVRRFAIRRVDLLRGSGQAEKRWKRSEKELEWVLCHLVARQGDQIGPIFASWTIVYVCTSGIFYLQK